MVPCGYIQAESEYTKDEFIIFEALDRGNAKEIARENILEKRIEFYELYCAGKVSLPQPVVKEKTFRQKLAGWLIGEQWP